MASEGKGLFRLQKKNGTWEWDRIPEKGGFPKTAYFYALCKDNFGRIWAGTGHSGIAVFDGNNWETYDRGNGFPGSRIFSIACSPLNGDIAIAHDDGLSICSGKTGKWTHFSTMSGLTTNQPSSVHFSPSGTLWVGFSCGGIAHATPAREYSDWEAELAPWSFGKNGDAPWTLTATGNGLPSNLVNVICPISDENIAVGTSHGFGFLIDANTRGKWEFIRGADFPAKLKGLLDGIPPCAVMPNPVQEKLLLPEDFVSCLKSTSAGLWVGFRRRGCILLDPADNFKMKPKSLRLDGAWVKDILPTEDGTIFVATYGRGLQAFVMENQDESAAMTFLAKDKAPPLDFSPISEAEINKIESTLSVQTKLPENEPWSVFLCDDWETRGNWCERYGQRAYFLCAVYAPSQNCYHSFSHGYEIHGGIGRSSKPDALRSWVHWVNKPENINILFEPEGSIREEAEWDDHGEGYAFEDEGPDVWAYVKVPNSDTNLVSLYFYNPNPSDWRAAYRDYVVEVRFAAKPNTKAKVLSRTRVSDFAGGGVYKNFAIGGAAGTFAFRVCRNNSFNTILNGVFVSRMQEPYFDLERESKAGWVYYLSARNRHQNPINDSMPHPPALDSVVVSDIPSPALKLWRISEDLGTTSVLGLQVRRHLKNLAYFSAKKSGAPDVLMANWRWHIGHWEQADIDYFNSVMRDGWRKRQEERLFANSAKWYPNSPNVVPFSEEELSIMNNNGLDWTQYRAGNKPKIPLNEMKKKIEELRKSTTPKENTPAK